MEVKKSPVVKRIEHLLSHTFTRIILYLTDGFLIAGSALLAPIFAIFVESIGGGIIEAGTAFTVFALTAGTGILFFSRIEDTSENYPKFVSIGYALAAFAYLLYIFINSPWQLYFAQFILGIAAAIRIPAYDVLLSRHSSHHLAVAWGNWNATAYLVSACSAALGAIIASTLGFTIMLISIFILSLIAFFLSLFLTTHRHEIEEEKVIS